MRLPQSPCILTSRQWMLRGFITQNHWGKSRVSGKFRQFRASGTLGAGGVWWDI